MDGRDESELHDVALALLNRALDSTDYLDADLLMQKAKPFFKKLPMRQMIRFT